MAPPRTVKSTRRFIVAFPWCHSGRGWGGPSLFVACPVRGKRQATEIYRLSHRLATCDNYFTAVNSSYPLVKAPRVYNGCEMIKTALLAMLVLALALVPAAAQVQGYKPVTKEMLENPGPDDWLMFSRTYDAQRYSPLKD